jgi:hypothetical protein
MTEYTQNGLKYIKTSEVKYKHESIFKGYWFDKESQRFFKSRWSKTAYLSESLNVAFFVSSEQQEYHSRKYTIRAVCMETGQFLSEVIYLKKLGKVELKELELQKFHTLREARKTIKKMDWDVYSQTIKEWRE